LCKAHQFARVKPHRNDSIAVARHALAEHSVHSLIARGIQQLRELLSHRQSGATPLVASLAQK
jgi:hypothetical protein